MVLVTDERSLYVVVTDRNTDDKVITIDVGDRTQLGADYEDGGTWEWVSSVAVSYRSRELTRVLGKN